ncbi:FAD synthetase [Peribacillus glennii]|uniref:FAD synthase n=1 Tax=Peribacillus glennii TaxID=2303991 RepID=A0A372LB04_9BACI|nr:FAD synthetase [Peribacillus glennii]RFU62961.1 FAD synthetase [Peribacillus glennii]
MKVIRNGILSLKHSVLTIGAFDGIHLGHQSLIVKTVNRARELAVPSVVYTFDPPPRVYFQKQMLLTTVQEKLVFLRKLGVDYTVIANFDTYFLSKSAAEFIEELKSLAPHEIWIGPDFQFGKGKTGSIKDLSEQFNTYTFPVVKCSKGEIISSTRIRKLLGNQQQQLAHELLGRNRLQKID